MSSILTLTIQLMQEAATLSELSGKAKKAYVLNKVRDTLELSDEVEEIIIAVIDMLIDVEKGKLIINPKVKKSYMRFISCCK